VVGGGVAGLTTALHLRDGGRETAGGLEVVVLEAAPRPGGNVRTDRTDGFTIEEGPNGYLDNVPATPALVRRLGLEDRLQKADERAAKRYLYRGGRLHLLPTGPLDFLLCPVLSLRGRLRVLCEPFARPRPAGVDETVYDFAARRIGAEAAGVLVDAMVSGVFAGNVRKLSLRSSFPKMARMEEEHGSLVRAMIARMKERRAARRRAEALRREGKEVEELTRPGGPAGPGGTLTSFRDGLDTLPRALAAELGGAFRPGTRVVALEEHAGAVEGRWTVHAEGGEALRADAVVLAVPAPHAVPILETLDAELARPVREMETAGLAVVALAYEAAEIGGDPDGFGFLVPRGEDLRILGCLWDSSIFPGRAPGGRVLLRAMIGGAHDPAAVEESDEALVSRVRADLRTAMGIGVEPLFTRVYRWPLGIGQYTVGHQERLDRVHGRLREHPGLWVAGSSYHGISMNACIEKAGEQAPEILRYVGSLGSPEGGSGGGEP